MKPQPQPTTQEVLAGPVERVTFHSRLTEVFRQAAQRRIITTAHRINQGKMRAADSRKAESQR
jgi:hypothetical protein